jgi:hypothetical protein
MEKSKTVCTLLDRASAHGLAARPGRPVPTAQRGCAHGVVTVPNAPMVAQRAGAHRWPRCDEVRTPSTGVMWHDSRASWWGRGCTVVMGHQLRWPANGDAVGGFLVKKWRGGVMWTSTPAIHPHLHIIRFLVRLLGLMRTN